jgi:hypothetical protein
MRSVVVCPTKVNKKNLIKNVKIPLLFATFVRVYAPGEACPGNFYGYELLPV